MTKRPSFLAAAVATCRALGHPARLRILALLADGGLCGCQLSVALSLAASTVSEHVAVLARAGLVQERRTGKLVYFELARSANPPATSPVELETLLASLARDPQIVADQQLVAHLRTLPISALTASRHARRLGSSPIPDPLIPDPTGAEA